MFLHMPQHKTPAVRETGMTDSRNMKGVQLENVRRFQESGRFARRVRWRFWVIISGCSVSDAHAIIRTIAARNRDIHVFCGWHSGTAGHHGGDNPGLGITRNRAWKDQDPILAFVL